MEVGDIVEGYAIRNEIGSGAQARVFRVVHIERGTHHALKVLSGATHELRQRMIREGRIHTQLDHPNIVRIDEVIEIDGIPALVMELIEGPTLKALLRDYQPTPDEARGIFISLLAAINAAHRQGFVHRDLKPDNILLALEGRGVLPKVMDFGLVKDTENKFDPGITKVNTVVGTPRYMAPEQIHDASDVDPRVDLYALGCILYELLAGRPAFNQARMTKILPKVLKGEYDPLPEGLPDDLTSLSQELMSLDPAARPKSALDVIVRLGLPAMGEPVIMRPEGRRVFFDAPTALIPLSSERSLAKQAAVNAKSAEAAAVPAESPGISPFVMASVLALGLTLVLLGTTLATIGLAALAYVLTL